MAWLFDLAEQVEDVVMMDALIEPGMAKYFIGGDPVLWVWTDHTRQQIRGVIIIDEAKVEFPERYFGIEVLIVGALDLVYGRVPLKGNECEISA